MLFLWFQIFPARGSPAEERERERQQERERERERKRDSERERERRRKREAVAELYELVEVPRSGGGHLELRARPSGIHLKIPLAFVPVNPEP